MPCGCGAILVHGVGGAAKDGVDSCGDQAFQECMDVFLDCFYGELLCIGVGLVECGDLSFYGL